MKKTILTLLIFMTIIPLYAIDSAYMSRQKTQENQLTNLTREKDKLWQDVELFIKCAVDQGKLETDVFVNEYREGTVYYVVKKLNDKGYTTSVSRTRGGNRVIHINW
jgi:hypothetical protein